MLGYIIEGTTTRIVENINEILFQATRSNETLKKKELDIPYLEEAYISAHLNDYVLHHYFCNFQKLKTVNDFCFCNHQLQKQPTY